MKRGTTMVPATFVGTLLLATASLASEAAHGGAAAEAHHGPDPAAWMTLAFSAVNFSIFCFLIYRYAWPAVKDYLAARSREVAEAMAAADKARQEAEAIRRDYAAREAALEETRRHMLDEIRASAQADRERVLRDAREAAANLLADAERQAESDLARARRELRAEAARLAAEIAERDVRSRLTDADRTRLVREFVEGVARP